MMAEWLEMLLILVAWYGLQAFVLPRLGVPT
jgi:hypothetical protein